MKIKRNIQILVLAAAFLLPASWAAAAVSLQFTQPSVTGAPGQDVQLTLQLVSTAEGVNAVDYWLAQTAGPSSGVLSITATTRTTSDFPNVSANDATVTSTGDTFSNSTGAPSSPDGVADNLLQPRNGPDLGATKNSPATDFGTGTFSLGTFTIHIAANALPGTYTVQSFDYAGFGWSGNVSGPDNPFSSQGSININVVPEPATWSLLAFGGVGSLGVGLLRARRRLS